MLLAGLGSARKPKGIFVAHFKRLHSITVTPTGQLITEGAEPRAQKVAHTWTMRVSSCDEATSSEQPTSAQDLGKFPHRGQGRALGLTDIEFPTTQNNETLQ